MNVNLAKNVSRTKKTIVLVFIGLAITANNAFGQTDTMLNLRKYAECFGFTNGIIDLNDNYIISAPRVERTGEISNLEGKERIIDTPLELALFSYYATSRIDIRPAEANAILPKNNPKLADQKLGAAVFQDIQVLRFLGDTVAVSSHETILKFITDRKNATRQEIEAFYRNGIRGLISQIVDKEFGKEGEQGIIPIRIYADWEKKGVVKDNTGKSVNGIELIKQTLTNFFLNPTDDNYIRVRGIIARILAYQGINDPFSITISSAWGNTLVAISPELRVKIRDSWGKGSSMQEVYAAAKQPNDPAFRIFEQFTER